MNTDKNTFKKLDRVITNFMQKYGIIFLRISIGIVFFWFGFLKFFPNISSAEGIAIETISKLTFGIIPNNISLIILATWEVSIGLGLIIGKYLKIVLFFLFTQMLGTLTPLILFPSETFTSFPIVPTLEGQYIIKNLILISSGFVIGAKINNINQNN